MEKLKHIVIGEKSYPFKIDLNVLEIIQNEYGSINEFERDLLGIKMENEGADAEETAVKQTEPSIKAIKTVLPAMINEGLEIEAEEKRIEFVPVSPKHIFQNCTIPYRMLSKVIHEEFVRCFETKKADPGE